MKTFNVQKFEESIDSRKNKAEKVTNKDYRMERFSYEDGNAVITLGQQGDGYYIEEIKEKNSVYKTVFLYYDDTRTLSYEGVYFKDTAIGIHKKYSKEGKIVEETNHDAELNDKKILTRTEMAKIMKQKFSINIEKEDELWLMNLYEKDGEFIWRIVCKANAKKGIEVNYAYKFNARTGEFLSKEPFEMEG
ncbi:hypothetical protein [Chryseobacterium paludis]|uniref:hypothetical protein n=1 Tax=Chryseobacterium paludis TaxID=2956784 RepID=UPI0021C041A9|nr:hypothetical protein [Chryseobacterium paludis]